MAYKKDIEEILEQLKTKGYERSEIEAALNYSENYIDQALSKGGNERFLKALITYNKSVLPKATLKQENPVLQNATTRQNLEKLELEDFRELLRNNRDLAAANKDLAAANLKLATDHSELVQLAKHAFGISLNKQPSGAEAISQEEGGEQPNSAQELRATGRSGAFQLVGQNVPKGNSKEKGK